MATWEHELVDPPIEPRALELWLHHTAGFILFQDVRQYAVERIDPALADDVRAAVRKGIDDAVYGLMMVIEGVSGGLSNANHTVHIDFIARLAARSESGDGDLPLEIDLRQGDGMCMGYHGWLEGNFGKDPVARSQSVSE